MAINGELRGRSKVIRPGPNSQALAAIFLYIFCFILDFYTVAGMYSLTPNYTGETEGLPEIIVDTLTMRTFERSAPTVYWLMPPAWLWNDTPFLFANGRFQLGTLSHSLMLGI